MYSGGVKCMHRADTKEQAPGLVKGFNELVFCRMIRVPYAMEGGRTRRIENKEYSSSEIRVWARDVLKAMGNRL